MSPVKSVPGEPGNVADLVARYQLVIEQARIRNVSADAVFEVLRMEAGEWNEDRIAEAVRLVQESSQST